MAKFKITDKVAIVGNTYDGDCYYHAELFRDEVMQSVIIDATDKNDANEKAKLLVAKE